MVKLGRLATELHFKEENDMMTQDEIQSVGRVPIDKSEGVVKRWFSLSGA